MQPEFRVVQAEAFTRSRRRQFGGVAGRVVGVHAYGGGQGGPFEGVPLVGVEGGPDGEGERDREEDERDQHRGDGHPHDTLSHAPHDAGRPPDQAGRPRAFAVV
ncbi:hypothetical protein O1M63_39350 [Streptomyces mirabilis]|nr:hypothetical protein [Streptomyces mirabilis]